LTQAFPTCQFHKLLTRAHGARWRHLSELTSAATLTESLLQQKLVENRRELKRRIESLRTFLWTALEALESSQPVTAGVGLVVDYAKGIDSVVSQICIAEQMLEQLKLPQVRKLMENPRVRERVQAIDELRKKQESPMVISA
jgi:hypothetical protein